MELIEKERNEMLEYLWIKINDENYSEEELEQIALERVDNISRLLFEAFDTHYVGLSLLQSENSNVTQGTWSMTTVRMIHLEHLKS